MIKSDHVSRIHFVLLCTRVIWSCRTSNNAGFDHEPWRWLEGIKNRRLARERRLLLRNLLIASNLIIPCPVVAALCSFLSMASNTLVRVSINPSRSVSFKTVIVLFLASGLGSSASSTELCHRISTRRSIWAHDRLSTGSSASSRELFHRISTRQSMWVHDHWSSGSSLSSRELCHRILTRPSSVSSWSPEFSNLKRASASHVRVFALGVCGKRPVWNNSSWGDVSWATTVIFLNLWADILTYLSKDVFIWRRRWRRYRVVLRYSWFRRRRQSQKFRSLSSQFQARVRPHSRRLSRVLLHHPRKRAASSTLDTTAAKMRRLLRRTVILFCPTFLFYHFEFLLWFPKPPLISLLCRKLFGFLRQNTLIFTLHFVKYRGKKLISPWVTIWLVNKPWEKILF